MPTEVRDHTYARNAARRWYSPGSHNAPHDAFVFYYMNALHPGDMVKAQQAYFEFEEEAGYGRQGNAG